MLHPHYGTSWLIRVVPPLCHVSVFPLSWVINLSFSVNIGTEAFHVPDENLDQVQATFMPDAAHAVSRLAFDFNASIAANRRQDVFVTWSSTDAGVNAEVRFSGRLPTEPLGLISSPGSRL